MDTATLMARADELQQMWDQSFALQRRFEKIFGETNEEQAQRWAREVEIDGEMTEIPAKYRLAVARQLVLALYEHGFINSDRDEAEEHWRVIATRLGLPYLEVQTAAFAFLMRGDVVRNDVEEWVEWCREHAPERLTGKVA